MTFEEKLKFARQELQNSKIGRWNYNPLFIRLLHKMGCKIRYPHYRSFRSNALLMGCAFGLFISLFSYLMPLTSRPIGFSEVVLTGMLSGLCFGLFMAWYYKNNFIKNNLTPWDEMNRADS